MTANTPGREALAAAVKEALRFAWWAAGEGFATADGQPAKDPTDFMMAACEAIGTDELEPVLAEVDALLRQPLPASVEAGEEDRPYLLPDPDRKDFSWNTVKRLVEKERAACLRAVEALVDGPLRFSERNLGKMDAAAAIRARSKTEPTRGNDDA